MTQKTPLRAQADTLCATRPGAMRDYTIRDCTIRDGGRDVPKAD